MNVLVTAGNTLVPIDRVRAITNVFTGRTGGEIALHAQERGHRVTLLTSHPEIAKELRPTLPTERWFVQRYQTFDDLQAALPAAIADGGLDAIIHSAAVSDYRTAGVYALSPTTRTNPDRPTFDRVVEVAGKIKSDEPELWLRLVRTPKLVDQIRSSWNFHGILVKFKLEVGLEEPDLVDLAERSRQQSQADLMVANTLEGKSDWAYLGPLLGSYQRIERAELAHRLIDAVERLHRERNPV